MKMNQNKQNTRGIFALILALAFTLSLLAGCGGKDDDEIIGFWESDAWGGVCLELREDGVGKIYTATDEGEIVYEWDGKTLTLRAEDSDGETEEITGEMQEDGSIGIMGLGYFFKVDQRSYGPDMESPNDDDDGDDDGYGMEAELEGDWIHSSGHLMLTFDGEGYVDFQDYSGESGYDYSGSSGPYTYDGETVILELPDGPFEGYIDDDGDLIIEIRGEGGWYSRGDSSQVGPPDISGPAAELVGDWENSETGDTVGFYSDGSVSYYIGGSIGFSTSFSYDGETVTFSDYTGYIDSYGDLIVEGVDHWFSRADSSGDDGGSNDNDDGGSNDNDDGGSGGYSLSGAYDNDEVDISIVFSSDGTVTISDFDTTQDGTYTVDGDYIYMEMEGNIPYEGWYDSSDDTFTVDGLDGHFYWVSSPWYTP